MNKMELVNLHKEVFAMLEEVRERHPTFFYGFRTASSRGRRIEDGFLFLGNGDYVWVPLCVKGASVHMTNTVGIVLKQNNKGVREVNLEIIIPKGSETPKTKELCAYEKLASEFGASRKEHRNYTRLTKDIPLCNNDMVAAAKSFLMDNGSRIVEILREAKKKDFAYDFNSFWNKLANHAKAGTVQIVVKK